MGLHLRFALSEGFNLIFLKVLLQCRIRPVSRVLGIGNGDDPGIQAKGLPHLPGHPGVQFGNRIRLFGMPKGRYGIIELFPDEFPAQFRVGQPAAKESAVVQVVAIAGFVSAFLRRMRGEDHLGGGNPLVAQVIKSRECMAFVQVVAVGPSQQPDKLCPADSQYNALGDSRFVIRVVEAVGDRPGKVVIVGDIRAEQVQGYCLKDIRWEYPDPNPNIRVVINSHRKLNPRILEVIVSFFHQAGCHGAVLLPLLVVIAVFPKHPDTDHILFQVKGGLQVGAGQKAQAPGIDFQPLVDTELHAEVGCTAGVFPVGGVRVVPVAVGGDGLRHIGWYFGVYNSFCRGNYV